ncbi:carbohydrate ABC transporter permease [Saccharomonospora halophila]|uniref:carbohydrate ABC transporter permease n=1 Tax=Saccharomonospora halophila TaxID=129922 RepID=UPI000375B23B|nr:sugar ABC transporter permease [Saccharomonospora halophila]
MTTTLEGPAEHRGHRRSTPERSSPGDRARAWRRRAPLLPALLFTVAVTQVPFLVTVVYSFQSWNLVRPGSRHFVGFDNYAAVFADSEFRGALLNTVLLTVVCVFVSLLLGLGLALLLDRRFVGRSVVRTLVVTPFLLLPAAGALLWKTTMFDPTYGLLNAVLGTDVDWLSRYPLGAVMTQVIWQWTPFMTLLILAGLQARPPEVLEAAQVDGAGRWRVFASITLPQLSRYLQLAALLGAIYIVNTFDAIYLMTQGGPGTASTNLPFAIYQRAFQGFDVGQSSAMGVLVVLLTLIVATFALRVMFRSFDVRGGVR